MKVEDIKNIAVIGTGIMGHGIAQVCAQAGYKTSITRRRVELLQESIDKIKSNLQMLVGKEFITKDEADNALSRIHGRKNIAEAVSDADFVIESVVEDMDVKKSVFREFDTSSPKHAILTTNTSSFSITEIASVTERQDKVAGMHWWNPPYLMPLVEIVKGEKTSDETVNVIRDLVTKLGKVPATCKDSPGFIGVRLQSALVNDAISILEEGLASAEDIDTAVKMTLGFRTPILGPLETVDLGGMDTFFYAYDYLHKKLGEKYKPPDLLRNKAKAGELGIKTGKGFYDYTGKSIESIIKNRDEWLMEQSKKLKEKMAAQKSK
jgi:3-hydroxybutyryl-CoA dehydrogenase